MTSKIVLLLACAAAIPAMAQQRHSPEERYKLFQDYLKRRASEITENNLADVKDLESWKRKRPEVLKRYLYSIGLDPMPEKTPLNARITRVLDRPGYRVENIVFESMPGFYVTGNFYLPKNTSGKSPVIVYVCGHSPHPAGAKFSYQYHGIWFAKHGYAAFVLDTIEFAELPDIHHGTHDLGMWYWHSLGYTPVGPEVWNAIRALDYLETRPEVDAKRAGITGISGGGAITWYAAAADERFKAAASVCGTWTVGQHVALDCVYENCDCIYFPNGLLLDLPAVGALIAPRPFDMLGAKKDVMFPPAGYLDAYQRTKPIYELYGASDKVAQYEYESPHRDVIPFRQEARKWLSQWLGKDASWQDPEEKSEEDAEALTVLAKSPVNPVNGHVFKTFISTAKLTPQTTLAAWNTRRDLVLREIKDKVLRAFPDKKVPFDAWKQKEGGWSSRYANSYNVEFTTEQDIRVTGQLYVPKSGKPSYPAAIYAKGPDDVIDYVDWDPLLPILKTHVVLVLQPRLAGYPAIPNQKMSSIRMTAALIGATPESMQLWDILRSVDYLVEGEGLKLDGVSVYGRKQMGALALYAAALDKRITRVILDDPPASHWTGAPLLNILRITDLPEVAAMVAPREIVSLTKLPAEYGYAASVYSLYGKKAPFRRAGSLGQALEVWRY